jgi:hypothetical protein
MRTLTNVRRFAFVLALIAMMFLVAAGAALGATATVRDIADPDSYTSTNPKAGFIDFEDLAEGTNLSEGAINGVQFTTTGGYTWRVADFATGNYNGKYPNGAYTAKGTHVAWLGTEQGSGRIDFVNGKASEFSLLVTAGSPVSLEAYNAQDQLLATAGPSAINTSTGHMDELRITRDTRDIAYVIVHDQGNFFAVDAISTDAPGVRAYDFTGFFQPVDNPGPGPEYVYNTVKAGSAIPVKFSLAGDQGLEIFAAGYPASQRVVDVSGANTDAIEQTVTAGNSSLSYDQATDQYTYVWKTEKAWAGQSRELIVKLADGSEHTALFKFK